MKIEREPEVMEIELEPEGLVDIGHPAVLQLLDTDSVASVRNMCRKGIIPCFRPYGPGGKIKLCLPILREFLQEAVRNSVPTTTKSNVKYVSLRGKGAKGRPLKPIRKGKRGRPRKITPEEAA
jgi:hypothetical protein